MTSTQHDPNAWLMGGGAPSARFEHPGDTVSGSITDKPDLRQQTDFTSGEPLFWPNGDPRMQLVVTLATELRDATVVDDDGTRRVYVKGNLQKAVQQAVRTAGAPGLEVGGVLTVTYTGDGEAKQRGMSPPKLYSASYTPAAQAFVAPAPQVAPPQAALPQAAPSVTPAAAAAVQSLSPQEKAALIAQLTGGA
jgi:hypothetical protein